MINKTDLENLLEELKTTISNDDRAEYDDTEPGFDITIGYDPRTENWNYQTGDNSFTGNAYGYPHWAVATLYRWTDTDELALELVAQLQELAEAEHLP